MNPKWTARVTERLNSDDSIDETTGYNPAVQWLIIELSRRNRPFILYQLGAGVKRVTTQTDKCPCCKQKLLTD